MGVGGGGGSGDGVVVGGHCKRQARILNNGENVFCNLFFAGWIFFWTHAELTSTRTYRDLSLRDLVS